MGNDISATNSIGYYQKNICGDSGDPSPVFRFPSFQLMENHDLDISSVVIRYGLDVDKDGYVSKEDIQTFIKEMQASRLDPNDSDFSFKSGAYFTQALCKDISKLGKDHFSMWVSKAIKSSFVTTENEGIVCIDGDAVKKIFDLLQIQSLLGRSFQWVLDMLQRHAEANLGMNLNDPAFDDLVPVETILTLIKNMVEGMLESYTMMKKPA